MEKNLIHFVVPFPTDYEALVIPEPRMGAFNLPAAFVTLKSPSIPKLYSFILPRRGRTVAKGLSRELACASI